MKMKLMISLLFSASLVFGQAVPQDVFLEADTTPTATSPVEDLPPDEPPYTKTPDELEAQELLTSPEPEIVEKKESEKKSAKNKKKQVSPETEVSGDSSHPKIAHPDAKKGLYLIDQNTGRYYYKTTKVSQKNQSTSIRVGMISPLTISTVAGGKEHTFEDIYGSDSLPYLILDYEWQPIRSFGKLGVIVGMGFFTASGNGRFANPSIEDGAAAKEGFTFFGLPISVGAIYRLEFSDRQWLAPFVNAGLSYYALGELRDDGKAPKIVGSPAGYGGAGVLFNITAWNKDIDFVMDREYGINNMWLAAEFRVIKGLNEDLDVSSDLVNIGISVDY